MASAEAEGPLRHLARGGVIVSTRAGGIQFGVPPETLKDALTSNIEMPVYYVIPEQWFDRKQNLSIAEIEFPCYFSFFLLKRRVTLVTTKEGEDRVRRVFQETLFGPTAENTLERDDFDPSYPDGLRPNLRKEMDYFARHPFKDKVLETDDCINFVHFNNDAVAVVYGPRSMAGHAARKARLGDAQAQGVEASALPPAPEEADIGCDDVTIVRHAHFYEVFEDARLIGRVPVSATHVGPAHQVLSKMGTPPDGDAQSTFEVPHFGVTMLGNSHGFDPCGTTTGFIVWVNRRGLMVDPPPHAEAYLRSRGLPPRVIDGVILTHCHADHDAGTFQRLLAEFCISVITTPTIYASFIRKYSCISGMPEHVLRRACIFRPAVIGRPFVFRGAVFNFRYTLHSIPTIGFSVRFADKVLVYSADTLYDKERIRAMEREAVLSAGRAQHLLDFNWDASIILHEAGIPPLHTPVANLMALPEDVRSRLFAVHIAEKDVRNTGLRRAGLDLQNTIVIRSDPAPTSLAIELLDLITNVPIFNHLHIAWAQHLLELALWETYDAGTVLVDENTPPDGIVIVASGTISVDYGGVTRSLSYGDWFGEESFLALACEQDIIMPSYVVTETRVLAVVLPAVTSFELLSEDRAHQDRILNTLRKLQCARRSGAWDVLMKNAVLESRLSCAQMAQLELLLNLATFKAGAVLWDIGDAPAGAFVVLDGTFVLEVQPSTADAVADVALSPFLAPDTYREVLPQLSLSASSSSRSTMGGDTPSPSLAPDSAVGRCSPLSSSLGVGDAAAADLPSSPHLGADLLPAASSTDSWRDAVAVRAKIVSSGSERATCVASPLGPASAASSSIEPRRRSRRSAGGGGSMAARTKKAARPPAPASDISASSSAGTPPKAVLSMPTTPAGTFSSATATVGGSGGGGSGGDGAPCTSSSVSVTSRANAANSSHPLPTSPTAVLRKGASPPSPSVPVPVPPAPSVRAGTRRSSLTRSASTSACVPMGGAGGGDGGRAGMYDVNGASVTASSSLLSSSSASASSISPSGSSVLTPPRAAAAAPRPSAGAGVGVRTGAPHIRRRGVSTTSLGVTVPHRNIGDHHALSSPLPPYAELSRVLPPPGTYAYQTSVSPAGMRCRSSTSVVDARWSPSLSPAARSSPAPDSPVIDLSPPTMPFYKCSFADLVAEFSLLANAAPHCRHTCRLRCVDGGRGFWIHSADLEAFLRQNPGFTLPFLDTYVVGASHD